MERIKKILGFCWHCGRYFKYPKWRRTNTAYVDDTMNFTCECKECYNKTIEYYDELWADYYVSR